MADSYPGHEDWTSQTPDLVLCPPPVAFHVLEGIEVALLGSIFGSASIKIDRSIRFSLVYTGIPGRIKIMIRLITHWLLSLYVVCGIRIEGKVVFSVWMICVPYSVGCLEQDWL